MVGANKLRKSRSNYIPGTHLYRATLNMETRQNSRWVFRAVQSGCLEHRACLTFHHLVPDTWREVFIHALVLLMDYMPSQNRTKLTGTHLVFVSGNFFIRSISVNGEWTPKRKSMWVVHSCFFWMECRAHSACRLRVHYHRNRACDCRVFRFLVSIHRLCLAWWLVRTSFEKVGRTTYRVHIYIEPLLFFSRYGTSVLDQESTQ